MKPLQNSRIPTTYGDFQHHTNLNCLQCLTNVYNIVCYLYPPKNFPLFPVIDLLLILMR